MNFTTILSLNVINNEKENASLRVPFVHIYYVNEMEMNVGRYIDECPCPIIVDYVRCCEGNSLHWGKIELTSVVLSNKLLKRYVDECIVCIAEPEARKETPRVISHFHKIVPNVMKASPDKHFFVSCPVV